MHFAEAVEPFLLFTVTEIAGNDAVRINERSLRVAERNMMFRLIRGVLCLVPVELR